MIEDRDDDADADYAESMEEARDAEEQGSGVARSERMRGRYPACHYIGTADMRTVVLADSWEECVPTLAATYDLSRKDYMMLLSGEVLSVHGGRQGDRAGGALEVVPCDCLLGVERHRAELEPLDV